MQPHEPAFTLLLGMPGGGEWILIGVVVLLMFGGKKIPELMRGIGKGMREFKDAKNDGKPVMENDAKDTEAKEKDASDASVPPQTPTTK
jgi:sec-independent protein translocase protein TatA